MDKPSVTAELQNLLLCQIVERNGIATTEDLLPFVERSKEKAWSDTVRWALIHMNERGWLACPFGKIASGEAQSRRNWLRRNRPGQKIKQQVWEITNSGRQHLDTSWVDAVIVSEETQMSESASMIEGEVKTISVNSYERNPEARKKCIEYHGDICAVCAFDFGKFYGVIGSGYIHVHHVLPLSEIKAEHQVNPVEDLCPVCPNCHAMLHKRQPPFSIQELRQLIAENK